ncbi:hypothetical protein F5876DRAFT_73005 [Lentinula aff. lateritia]|uniref:Uncharacterized protein n=1 Tax=Lentinula aff. lateritia TaxID=2804960 RepID=A0ACC1UCM2_9AGAR|nr:hypothetical protein F5876DRAFT_73005 [Lentinula aff. lateritia]
MNDDARTQNLQSLELPPMPQEDQTVPGKSGHSVLQYANYNISHPSAYVIVIFEEARSVLRDFNMAEAYKSAILQVGLPHLLSSAGPVERPLSLPAENNLVPLQTLLRILNPPEHYTMRLAPAFVVTSLALFTIVHAAPHAPTRQTMTSQADELLVPLPTQRVGAQLPPIQPRPRPPNAPPPSPQMHLDEDPL